MSRDRRTSQLSPLTVHYIVLPRARILAALAVARDYSQMRKVRDAGALMPARKSDFARLRLARLLAPLDDAPARTLSIRRIDGRFESALLGKVDSLDYTYIYNAVPFTFIGKKKKIAIIELSCKTRYRHFHGCVHQSHVKSLPHILLYALNFSFFCFIHIKSC